MVVNSSRFAALSAIELFDLDQLFPHQMWDQHTQQLTLSNCGGNCVYSHGNAPNSFLKQAYQSLRQSGTVQTTRQFGKVSANINLRNGQTFQLNQ